MQTILQERMGDDQTSLEKIGERLITIKRSISRISKGVNISNQVEILDGSTARVYSQYDKTKSYIVDYAKNTCTCPDHIFRKVNCGHIIAVRVVLNLKRCQN